MKYIFQRLIWTSALRLWKNNRKYIWTFVKNKDLSKLKNKSNKDRYQRQELLLSLIRDVLKYFTCILHILWVSKKLPSSYTWPIRLSDNASTPTESMAEQTNSLPTMLNFHCFDITKTTGSFRKVTKPSSMNKMKKGMRFKWSSESECLSTDGLTPINIKTRMRLS